jgi:hypothetical protein
MPAALHRPEPVLRHRAQPVDRNVPTAQAAAWLREGRSLLVTDRFGTGLDILAELRVQLEDPGEDGGYVKKRAFREAFQAASKNLLAPVVGRKVALADAPRPGFLAELYPDHADFALPVEDARVLSSAWDWYDKGVHFPVLGYRVHPFYGTYIPARMEHLELFGTWLAKYQGARHRAIDVGTGSGVLALQMAKAGFEHVLATDINPNAIESVARQLRRLPKALPIELENADLLGTDRGPPRPDRVQPAVDEGRGGPHAGPGDVLPGRLLRTLLRAVAGSPGARWPHRVRVLEHHRAVAARRAASHPDRARSRAVPAGGEDDAPGEAAAATHAGEGGGLGTGRGLTAAALSDAVAGSGSARCRAAAPRGWRR